MQKTALICSNFSGINRSSSVYSSSVITASDIQNVELFATEINSGVGIRTAKGNVAVCDLIPADEKIINIFESVQKSQTYFFVHTENKTEGKIYLYSRLAGTLTEKVNGLKITGVSSATDVSQGWSDLWVFSNQKIARGMNIDLSSEGRKNLFKDVRVVIPRDNSKLVELIKKSDEMKAILKRENDNILDGKYKNKYLPGGVEFKMPPGRNLNNEQWRDQATLFGVIHNADIYNIRENNDGSIDLTISDFYDFENWKINDSDSNSNKFIKFLNNNADAQQKAGELTPYVLYIPVKFTQNEFEELMK